MIKSIVPIDTIQGDNMYFKRLRDLREDHDMKQSEVAEYLGIQQTVYSRYERGFQSIPVEHLINARNAPPQRRPSPPRDPRQGSAPRKKQGRRPDDRR